MCSIGCGGSTTASAKATGLPNSGVQVRQNLALLYAMRGDIDTAGRLLDQGLTDDMAEHNLTFYRQLHSRLASRVGKKRREQPAAPAEPADETSTAALEGGGVAGGAPAPVAPAQGLMVRLGVFSTEERASAWLAALRDVHADLFADLEFEIADVGTGEAASGYRLLAGPLASEALAADLCTKLHSRREACTILVP